jgi:hypothetical protein
MTSMPILKTPIGSRERSRKTSVLSSLSRNENFKSNPSRVRFESRFSTKKPISMSQTERERRKHEALDFLRNETSSLKNSMSSGSFSYKNNSMSGLASNTDPASLKTYELLGEAPINRIKNIPSRSILYDDNAVKNITKKSLKSNPLGYKPPFLSTSSRISDYTSRVNKPKSFYTNDNNNNGLLNSLSKFGSKVFRSILYNEEDTSLNRQNNNAFESSHISSLMTDDILKSQLKQKELNLQLAEKQRYLNELNKQIMMAEQETVRSPTFYNDQSKAIDKQIEKLDERLQNVLDEVNSTSNGKLLKELGGIKEELTSLRRKQESNNIKFESQFEDMRIENQMNRQKFDRLFKNLEEKRKELDLEKNSLIQILKDQKNTTRSGNKSMFQRHESSPLKSDINLYNGFDDDISNENEKRNDDFDIEFEEASNISDDSAETRDILRYILKNKRQHTPKNSRIKSRMRKIRNNLKQIENVTNRKD